MAVDFQKHTRREAGKELAAIEAHLRGLDASTAVFCLECLGKHLMHLSALAGEGKTFFPDDVEFWAKIEGWADGVLDFAEANKVAVEQTRKWAEEAREMRKNLQAKYMGLMGQCDCVTGLEPCCKGRK